MKEELSINQIQRRELSTCLPSSRNLAYPSLGLFEEVAEFAQKLQYLIDWNEKFPKTVRDRIDMLLRGIITCGISLGKVAKQLRHQDPATQVIPFKLKYPAESDIPEFIQERIDNMCKELGDIHWMIDAIHFYINNPDGTDPTDPSVPMTAQSMSDQNYRKLAERRALNTIDGQGDTTRTSIS